MSHVKVDGEKEKERYVKQCRGEGEEKKEIERDGTRNWDWRGKNVLRVGT